MDHQLYCMALLRTLVHVVMTFILAASRGNRLFAYAKTKTQISFAVTAKLISTFVFATRIVQSLYFLNPKFQASSHLLWLCSSVCVGPTRKPRRPVFSQRGSYILAASRVRVSDQLSHKPTWFSHENSRFSHDVVHLLNLYFENEHAEGCKLKHAILFL